MSDDIRVVVQYYRKKSGGEIRRYFKGQKQFVPETKGGVSLISIESKTANNFGLRLQAIAVCRSDEVFCYRYGRAVCASRLLSSYSEDMKLYDTEIHAKLMEWAKQLPPEWSVS